MKFFINKCTDKFHSRYKIFPIIFLLAFVAIFDCRSYFPKAYTQNNISSSDDYTKKEKTIHLDYAGTKESLGLSRYQKSRIKTYVQVVDCLPGPRPICEVHLVRFCKTFHKSYERRRTNHIFNLPPPTSFFVG